MAVIAQLNIAMDDTGKVSVNGVIEQKLMAYGLLELARDAIVDYHKNKDRLVQPAPVGTVFPLPPKN